MSRRGALRISFNRGNVEIHDRFEMILDKGRLTTRLDVSWTTGWRASLILNPMNWSRPVQK
jgi:hypothetical protein